MGANQSAGKMILMRPRTPLQFGSAPTALSANSSEFITCPKSYLPTNQSTENSVSSLLSQESYFDGFSSTPSITSSSSESITFSRTQPIPSMSSASSSPAPHRFNCPGRSCPYTIIGYSTLEELEEHMFIANHFAVGSSTGLEFSDYDWLSPIMLQRQQVFEQQRKRQQVQRSQQCNCHYCLHQGDYGNFIQYEPQPSMQIQMPPPPTIIGYHDAGFELVSWRQPELPYDSSSNHQMNQAEYSSLVQSGMYMDYNLAGAAGRSSFM